MGVEELDDDAPGLVEAAGAAGAVGDRLEDAVEGPRHAEGREVLGQQVAQAGVDDGGDGHLVPGQGRESRKCRIFVRQWRTSWTWNLSNGH